MTNLQNHPDFEPAAPVEEMDAVIADALIPHAGNAAVRALGMADGIVNPSDINSGDRRRWSGSTDMSNTALANGHMPHSI